jgi:hypothetical protein
LVYNTMKQKNKKSRKNKNKRVAFWGIRWSLWFWGIEEKKQNRNSFWVEFQKWKGKWIWDLSEEENHIKNKSKNERKKYWKYINMMRKMRNCNVIMIKQF